MKQLMNALKNAGYFGIGVIVITSECVSHAVAKGKMASWSYQDAIDDAEAEYNDHFDEYGHQHD